MRDGGHHREDVHRRRDGLEDGVRFVSIADGYVLSREGRRGGQVVRPLVLVCWRARISNGRSVDNSDPATPTFHVPSGADASHFSLPGPGSPEDSRSAGTSQSLFFFRERCCLWPASRPPNAVLSPRYLFPIRIPLYSVIHNSSLYTHYMHAPSKRKKWKSVWSAALRVMD